MCGQEPSPIWPWFSPTLRVVNSLSFSARVSSQKKLPAATFASGANLRAACKDGNLRSLQCRGELVVSEMMM